MTYKQMTEQLNDTSMQIEFLYRIRDEHFKEDKDSCRMIGKIVNNILAYQNYLQYIKEWEEKIKC
jgi:hypothetical protein